MKEKNVTVQELSVADQIWNEIKNLPMAMFALPAQRVSDFVKRIEVTPTEVHLKLNASAVLTMLEAVLAPAYQLEQVEDFVIVRRAPAKINK